MSPPTVVLDVLYVARPLHCHVLEREQRHASTLNEIGEDPSSPLTRRAKNHPRYVENELLGMKSLFENKEACLREELGEERDNLAREAAVLRERLEQAETAKAAAEVCRLSAFVFVHCIESIVGGSRATYCVNLRASKQALLLRSSSHSFVDFSSYEIRCKLVQTRRSFDDER